MSEKDVAKKAAKAAEKKPDKKEAAKTAPAKLEKPAKAAKPQKMHLPPALELAYSLPVFLLVLMDVVMAAISYLSGASLIEIFLRVLVTTLAMGFVLWLIVYLFTRQYTPEKLKDEDTDRSNPSMDMNF